MAFIARSLTAILAIAALPGSAYAQQSPQTIYAAWSQITGETSTAAPHITTTPGVQLRWVTDADGDCGSFQVSDQPAGQGGTIVDLDSTDNTWAQAGQIDKLVCFFDIPKGWSEASLLQRGAAAVLTSKISYSDQSSDPSGWIWQEGASNGLAVTVKGPAWIGAGDELTMLTLGDTGCRGFPKGASSRSQQNCDNTSGQADWPLALLSEAAADHRADMVIHVGDYRYFYEGEISVDSWDLWQKDFFPAAQPLLLAAPWVFVRGNHEGCPGDDLPYGVGYFQFFGTLADRDCDALGDHAYMKPWFFDIGAGADAHRTVVLDVSAYNSRASAAVPDSVANFETAREMVSDGPESSWWTFHTPGVQLTYYSSAEHTGEPTVTQALLQATGQGTMLTDRFCDHGENLRCRPSQFLMGHQHLFQSVTFPQPGKSWTFPRQMIVGHGGTKVDTANPAPSGETCHYSHFPIGSNGEDVSGYAHTDQTHGLVLWTRDTTAQAGWTGQQIFATDPGTLVPLAITDAGTAPACYLD